MKGAFVWDIPEYILAILVMGEEYPEWKFRYSGMRIVPKQTLSHIIPIIGIMWESVIILIPDWSQTNVPQNVYTKYVC